MAENFVTFRGEIINHDERRHGDIVVNLETGLIEEVRAPSGTPDHDFSDAFVFPGFGDVHIHAREDASGSQSYKEDFVSASAAALTGGVVHFAEMPNNPAPPVDDESYSAKEQLAARAEPVHATLYAGIGPQTQPLARAVPYKVFMGPSVGDLFFTSLEDLEKTIARYEGQSVSFHAEDPAVLEEHRDAPRHEDRRPREAEIKGVAFAIGLVRRHGIKGKICHVSTAEAVHSIWHAKQEGLSITAEATPHHLYFDDTMFTDENRRWLQVNPPIRTKGDHLALLEALRNGTIDYLATDHAPHAIEEKEKGTSGMPHLDTYGPFTAWLMAKQGFAPEDIARIAAHRPGEFIRPFLPAGFGEGFGIIAPGYQGSLTVIDLSAPQTVERRALKTKCGWSPFEGITFPGRVVATVIRGKVIANNTN